MIILFLILDLTLKIYQLGLLNNLNIWVEAELNCILIYTRRNMSLLLITDLHPLRRVVTLWRPCR